LGFLLSQHPLNQDNFLEDAKPQNNFCNKNQSILNDNPKK